MVANTYTRYWREHSTLVLSEVVAFDVPDLDALVEQGIGGRSESYSRDVRGIVRALWNGSVDYSQAFGLMMDTVRIGLTRAANEGLESVGMQPADRTPEERVALEQWIVEEIRHIDGLLSDVLEGSKANGGKLGPLLSRANRWGLRYTDIANRARMMAQNDPKLEWVINYVRQVKQNCSTCLKLNGKVKRASTWLKRNLHPQNPPNPELECGGWNCGCGLVPAPDKPMSRGPLPNTP